MTTSAPVRLLSRQLARMEFKTVASTSKKPFTTTSRQCQDSYDELLTSEDAPSSSTKSGSLTQHPFPGLSSRSSSGNFASSSSSSQSTGMRAGNFRHGPTMARYRLHAHCAKHNTILSLTRDVSLDMQDASPREVLNNAGAGTLQSGNAGSTDPKVYGQTVLRSSCGTVGFKKGQRSTFEAATRASNQMFDMIEKLGQTERKTKEGKRIIDPEPNEITLVLKGFGQGREAVFAALQTDAGKRVKNMIRRITDATPIKIGGTRPRKRRNIGYSDPNRFLRL